MEKIELGDRVKDIISGAQGIVYGISDWLFGCRRIIVAPEAIKDGKPAETIYLDEPQLQILEKHVIGATGKPVDSPEKAKPTGGPRDGEGHERRSDVRR